MVGMSSSMRLRFGLPLALSLVVGCDGEVSPTALIPASANDDASASVAPPNGTGDGDGGTGGGDGALPGDGGVAPGTVTRLAVSGAKVLDPSGAEIVLRGYNWGQWGTAQPNDAVDNLAQGASSVRLPLRWWGNWKPGVDCKDSASPGHIEPGRGRRVPDDVSRGTA